MTVRPILFSGPMVRALLDGRKTQTRRIAMRQDIFLRNGAPWVPTGIHSEARFSKPGWDAGDVLWVRERWAAAACSDGFKPSELSPGFHLKENGGLWFEADGQAPRKPVSPRGKWRQSMFMPRWASRLTLTMTAVRVERLQDISEEDAIAEGCVRTHNQAMWLPYLGSPHPAAHTASGAYAQLWMLINGNQSWPANPWIVALTFTVHKQNVDAFLAEKKAA